jgi:hypothetical protein
MQLHHELARVVRGNSERSECALGLLTELVD